MPLCSSALCSPPTKSSRMSNTSTVVTVVESTLKGSTFIICLVVKFPTKAQASGLDLAKSLSCCREYSARASPTPSW